MSLILFFKVVPVGSKLTVPKGGVNYYDQLTKSCNCFSIENGILIK